MKFMHVFNIFHPQSFNLTWSLTLQQMSDLVYLSIVVICALIVG